MKYAITRTMGAILLPLGMTLAACSTEPEPPTEEAVEENGTLAEVIFGNNDLDTLSDAILDAQLGEIFDGAGAYTVLSPTDEAFEALGEGGEALMTEEQRPVMVGILREHILPGHLTAEAIGTAIDRGNGTASMATLGSGQVTFRRDGEALTVSHSDGAQARLLEGGMNAGNGSALPIDAILVSESGNAAQ